MGRLVSKKKGGSIVRMYKVEGSKGRSRRGTSIPCTYPFILTLDEQAYFFRGPYSYAITSINPTIVLFPFSGKWRTSIKLCVHGQRKSNCVLFAPFSNHFLHLQRAKKVIMRRINFTCNLIISVSPKWC